MSTNPVCREAPQYLRLLITTGALALRLTAAHGAAVSRNASAPVVINNLKYWGASRHTGFVLMPNEVEAYRLGPNAFEFKGTNGFMITFDIYSNTAPPAPGSKSGM